jgi:DNA replication licensing factor MCM3
VDEDELYRVTPKPQRTSGRTQTSQAGASSSQVSAASSRPESQLPPTQTESQESQNITPARLQVFQTALGQLIDSPLFRNDAADLEPLIAAVNARLGGGAGRGAFDTDEAEKALEILSEQNKVMYSGGIVYKI